MLSLLFFSAQSLRLDEAQSLWQSGRSPGEIITIVGQDVHVPLYHELLHFWRLIMGDSVAAARGFSLLFYLLSIPAIYLLGTRAYGRTAGLIGAGLLALSPFMNWYGGEVRMYTLFIFLAICNHYAFLRLWSSHTPTTVAGREHAWAWYILTALLGIYTHYFFALLLATQALFFFVRRTVFPAGSLRRFVVAGAIVCGAFLPWALYVLVQGQAQNASPVLTAPTTVDLFNTVAQLVLGFHSDHLNTVLLSLWPVVLLAGFLALRRGRAWAPETEYFALSVIVPLSVVFAVSFVRPLFVSRYLIFTVPPLYLVLVSLFNAYPGRARVVAHTALLSAMALMLAVEIASPTTPLKENYREAVLYLHSHARAQDVIAVSAPFTVYPIEYYYRGEAALATLPAWDRYQFGAIPTFDESRLPQDVEAATAGHQNIWLLLSYDQGYEGKIKDYFDQHYEKLSEESFSPGLNLYQYKVRYDTPLALTHE